MKNKKVQLVIVLILALAVSYLVVSNNRGVATLSSHNFAVSDTASVNKLVLSDKQNNRVMLERYPRGWIVNGGDEAKSSKVNSMLKILKDIKVKEPVAKAYSHDVIKSIDTASIKVDVYSDGRLLKTFYVGKSTENLLGTYMIMESSTQPFVIELAGFRGYLNANFSTNEFNWKNKIVFNISSEEIKQISIKNVINASESFAVLHKNKGVELYNYKNNRVVPLDTNAMQFFLKQFSDKGFIRYVDDISPQQKTSILQNNLIYIITVESNIGNVNKVKVYSKPSSEKVDFFGNKLGVDSDIFFILLGTGEFVYAKYINYNAIFKDVNDFTSTK